VSNVDVDGLFAINPAQMWQCAGDVLGSGIKLTANSIVSTAINIASNVVKNQIANKTLNQSLSNANVQSQIADAVYAFYSEHKGQMSFLDYLTLGVQTNNYFKGLNLMAWWAKGDFLKLNRAVIQNTFIPEEVKIQLVQAGIIDAQDGFQGIIHASADVALFIAGNALFPNVGNGPKLPFKTSFNSVAAKGGLQLESSVAKVMGNSYKSISEVTVPIKNTGLLNSLNAASKGNWVKVYEAGIKNGAKIETHYFRNSSTNQVFDVKIKYNYWHQKSFKSIGL